MKKWDHVYEIGDKDWCSFRGKVLYNSERKYLYVVIKGIGRDEIVISGDLPTVERKLREFVKVLDQILEEVTTILEFNSPYNNR